MNFNFTSLISAFSLTVLLTACASGATVVVTASQTQNGVTNSVSVSVTVPPSPPPPPADGGSGQGGSGGSPGGSSGGGTGGGPGTNPCFGLADDCGGGPGETLPYAVLPNDAMMATTLAAAEIKMKVSANKAVQFTRNSGAATIKLLRNGAVSAVFNTNYVVQNNFIKAADPVAVQNWIAQNWSESVQQDVVFDVEGLSYNLAMVNAGEVVTETFTIYIGSDIHSTRSRSYVYGRAPSNPNDRVQMR